MTDFRADGLTVKTITAPVTVYVGPAGNDANPGTLAAPVLTVERAYQIASKIGFPTVQCLAGKISPGTSFLNMSGLKLTGALTEALDIATDPKTITNDAAYGYSTIQLTTDPHWTVNQWRGYMLQVNDPLWGVYEMMVISNTSDTLVVTGYVWDAGLKVMELSSYFDAPDNFLPTGDGMTFRKLRFLGNVGYRFASKGMANEAYCLYFECPSQGGVSLGDFYAEYIVTYQCQIAGLDSINTRLYACATIDTWGNGGGAYRDIRSIMACTAWNAWSFYYAHHNDAGCVYIYGAGGTADNFITFNSGYSNQVFIDWISDSTITNQRIVVNGEYIPLGTSDAVVRPYVITRFWTDGISYLDLS